MKVRKNLLAWIGIVLAVLGMGAVLISNISKWFVLIPVVVLVTAVVALLRGVAFVGFKAVRWTLVAAWSLAVLFAIATVLVAVFFGWLALLPFVLLCGAVTWLVYLLKKTLVWLPGIALVIAIILLGVYAIMGSLLKDWNAAIDTLTVKTLIVEDADVENENVNNQNVENQNVNNQKVENSEVKNQKVENQTVTNQKVENQTVTNQKVENQTVTNQKVENQTVTNQKVEKPTVNKQDKEDGTKKEEDKKEEPHKHSYASKVVAPTCTEKGYTLYTCACGHSYKDAYKDALGHKYTSKVVDPTTDAQGYTLHTCERCGHSYKDNYTDKLQPVVTPKLTQETELKFNSPAKVKFEGISYNDLVLYNSAIAQMNRIDSTTFEVELTADVTGEVVIAAVSGQHLITLNIVF